MSATRSIFGHLGGEPQSNRSAFKVLRAIKQPNKMNRQQITTILIHQRGGNIKDQRPQTSNIKCIGSIFPHC